MEIRTFTSFWNLEKKLYSIYDFQMPVPISLRVLGVFFGTGLPWWLFLYIVHFPGGSPWFMFWIVPPGALAWFGSKPIFEGKTLFQYLRSRAQFLFENKNYKKLEPDLNKYDELVKVKQNIMTRPTHKPKPF